MIEQIDTLVGLAPKLMTLPPLPEPESEIVREQDHGNKQPTTVFRKANQWHRPNPIPWILSWLQKEEYAHNQKQPTGQVFDALSSRLRFLNNRVLDKFVEYTQVEQSKQDNRNEPRYKICLLYTSPSPRDLSTSRMPSSA